MHPAFFRDSNALRKELDYLSKLNPPVIIRQIANVDDDFSIASFGQPEIIVCFYQVTDGNPIVVKSSKAFKIFLNSWTDIPILDSNFTAGSEYFITFTFANPPMALSFGSRYTAFRRIIILGNTITVAFKDIFLVEEVEIALKGSGGGTPPDTGGGQGNFPIIGDPVTRVTIDDDRFQWQII